MCKPATTTDIDPNSGLTYRAEIDNTLKAFGFLPLPNLQVEDGQGDSSVGQATTRRSPAFPTRRGATGSAPRSTTQATRQAPRGSFAAANLDTDNSAVNGTYDNVENGSATLQNDVTASAAAPIGYCITESTDASPAGQ